MSLSNGPIKQVHIRRQTPYQSARAADPQGRIQGLIRSDRWWPLPTGRAQCFMKCHAQIPYLQARRVFQSLRRGPTLGELCKRIRAERPPPLGLKA